jgi:hypothetical protein
LGEEEISADVYVVVLSVIMDKKPDCRPQSGGSEIGDEKDSIPCNGR